MDTISASQGIAAAKSNDPSLPVVWYTDTMRPVVKVGTDVLQGQFGVVVEQTTEDIYVANQSNNNVKVFSREATFLFQFGTDKMRQPLCIAIYRDRVFVTQHGGGCLLVYDLDGRFIQQIGSTGSMKGQFDRPWGIAIHNGNGDIYICDSSNNRVQVFSNDYSYKSQFGLSILHKRPRDVQLTQDSIFVLSSQYPFFHTFNYSYHLTQLHNTVCDSICKHLFDPFSFIIDGNGNFIISDYFIHGIDIFDKTGHLLHVLTDSLSKPTGVCLNSKGRIIVVGYRNPLLIF